MLGVLGIVFFKVDPIARLCHGYPIVIYQLISSFLQDTSDNIRPTPNGFQPFGSQLIMFLFISQDQVTFVETTRLNGSIILGFNPSFMDLVF